MSVEEWLDGKPLSWRRVALAEDGTVMGHVGLKASRDSSDVELCRLMVRPEFQRRGLASHLVGLAVQGYGTRLFAVVGPESPSHQVLRGHGWIEAGETVEPGETATCVVMRCVTERTTTER